MLIGTCKLCLQEGAELQHSHLMPQFCYRALQRSEPGTNPVIVNHRTAYQSSGREWRSLLCAECEGRLSKNGERYAASVLSNGEVFPLLETLNAAQHEQRGPFRAYSQAATPSIDRASIAYFAMSVYWRYSLVSGTDRNHKQDTDLGPYAEPVRRFLLGECSFPKHMYLWAIASADKLSQVTIIPPTNLHMKILPRRRYALQVPGMLFILMVGKEATFLVPLLCLISSPERWLLSIDTSDKVTEAFSLLLKHHKR